MSTSLPNVAKFLYNALRNSAGVAALVGTRIYEGEPPAVSTAPETVVYPCVVFQLHTHTRELALGLNETALELPWYVVKAITVDGDYGGAYVIQRACLDALKNAWGDVAYAGRTWTIQGVRFGDDLQYIERDSVLGRVNHVGSNVRLFVCNER